MRKHPHAPKSNAGFSIIESLIALSVISIAVVAANKQFIDNRDATAIRKARAMFDRDMVRAMLLTRENNVCEKLNIMGLPMPGINNEIKLKTLTYDGVPYFEVDAAPTNMKTKLYRIKDIKLVQTSIQFGVTPKRARAQIEFTAAFYSTKGDELKLSGARKDKDTKSRAEIIIASRDGTTIDSCYGVFSRRITCNDENKTYSPEEDPSCK